MVDAAAPVVAESRFPGLELEMRSAIEVDIEEVYKGYSPMGGVVVRLDGNNGLEGAEGEDLDVRCRCRSGMRDWA